MADTTVEMLMMKGAISELPQEEQDRVAELAQEFRDLIAKDDQLSYVAFVIVALEEQQRRG